MFDLVNQSFKSSDEMLQITDWLVRWITYLSQIPTNFIPKIAEKLKSEQYEKGEFIVREGEVGDWVFFLYTGIVDIIKD